MNRNYANVRFLDKNAVSIGEKQDTTSIYDLKSNSLTRFHSTCLIKSPTFSFEGKISLTVSSVNSFLTLTSSLVE